ncbi:MAG TPA: hypothetical protein VJ949_08935, partial [Cryomorphaceae bacterium]|nr:hypothetical protein [Cryomorphaceae bacterium]
MMKTILCALAVMALIGVKGQSLTIDRATTFGGTNSDIATSISRTNDGGFIVAGYTQSNNLDVTGAISGEDAWILKLSSNGFLQWKKIVGGSGDDRAYDIVQTQNGDFVFAGTTNSETGDVTNPLGGFDAWMVRLNPNGVVVWSRNLGGSDDDAFYDVFEAPNGALAAVGESKSDIAGTLNRGGYDYYLSALNSNGSTLLQRQYGGSADDQARAASFSGGSVYIMGTTASDDGNVSDNKGGTDLWLVKTNATGNLQFEQSFGGSNNDVGSSLVISSNNLLMAGTTESDDQDLNSNNGGKDFFLVKFNTSNGQTSWARSYGSDGDEEAYSLIASSDGGAALIGYSDGNDQDVPANYGGRDQWLLNVNGSGNVTAS